MDRVKQSIKKSSSNKVNALRNHWSASDCVTIRVMLQLQVPSCEPSLFSTNFDDYDINLNLAIKRSNDSH